MLAKINRLTKNRDFLKIFKSVRPYHTEHLVLRAAKSNRRTEQQKLRTTGSNEATGQSNKAPIRFGFVISNKIDKRSARRNGLKRRIRAVVERKLPEIQPGMDVVIQVKKPFNYPYNFVEIEREVLAGLGRAGIIK